MGGHEMPLSASRARVCELYAESMGTTAHPRHPEEAVERDAIQREAELAVPQRIPQVTMLAGLLKVSRRWK